VVIFIVLVPEPLTDVGVKDAEVRFGSPVTENVTAPVKPFDGVIVTVYDVDDLRLTVCDAGVTEIVKSARCNHPDSVSIYR
jgi:hypothetical protein